MDRIDNQYFRPILLKNPKKIGVTEINEQVDPDRQTVPLVAV